MESNKIKTENIQQRSHKKLKKSNKNRAFCSWSSQEEYRILQLIIVESTHFQTIAALIYLDSHS